MMRQSRAYTAIIIAAFSMAVLFHLPAGAAGGAFSSDAQAVGDSLYIDLEQAFHDDPLGDLTSDVALIGSVYEDGSIPVVVRLRDSDLFYGFSSDMQRLLRFEITASLQNMVLDDMFAQTAGSEVDLPFKRFSMPAIAEQGAASESETFPGHPAVVDVVEDVPVSPVLQDGNFLDVGNDASIIAVQVLSLFNNEDNRGGELDLYLGFNSQLDEDYDLRNSLPQAGQTFYGGLNWTF